MNHRFEIGERVICLSKYGTFYYAKTIDVKYCDDDKMDEFLVHYPGWNSSHDEWVGENLIFKEHNKKIVKIMMKQRQEQQQEQEQKKEKRKSDLNSSSPSLKKSQSRPRKRSLGKLNDNADKVMEASPLKKTSHDKTDKVKKLNLATPALKKTSQDKTDKGKTLKSATPALKKITQDKSDRVQKSNSATPGNKKTPQRRSVSNNYEPPQKKRKPSQQKNEDGSHLNIVQICMPDILEKWTAEDWHQMKNPNPKLVHLPAQKTVSDILDLYEKEFSRDGEEISKKREAIEVMFNEAFDSQLLVDWERPQYSEILEQRSQTPPSKIYGAHHFLRLIIKLASSICNLENTDLLSDDFQNLLDFLVDNEEKFFSLDNYMTPPTDYPRSAM